MATILIADDRGSNRQFLVTLFGYFGHRIVEAEDGSQALALACAERPDLLFTDVFMPVIDGIELARQFRADPKLAAIPIIFYTATYRGAEFKKLAKELGIAKVISKPSEPQAILNALAEVLATTPPMIINGAEPSIKAAPRNRITEDFLDSIQDIGATVLRLNATIELGIELMREQDPQLLVETFCRGAQDIIGAKYAACGMIAPHSGEIAYLHICGLPAETADLLREAAHQGTLLEWMMTNRCIDRRQALAGNMRRVGLPPQHPYIDNFLGIPLHGSEGMPGWLYLAEKFAGGSFTDEDERLASTLAWQASVGYQNACLHDENHRKTIDLERHATMLATQIEERDKANLKRVELEHQLLHAQKMEAIGTLAGGIAHDINNCLVPIMTLTELALETLAPGSREQNCIAMVRDAGTRIRDLVRRILVFSRRDEIVSVAVDLTAVFRETVNLLRATIPSTIELRCRGEQVKAIIEGDGSQLQQVLLNLCVNAADAIDDGRRGVIEISLDDVNLERPLEAVGRMIPPGHYYRLGVSDNGSGMDKATIGRIFEPFYTTKAPGKGTGLGLSMVHTIVISHSGHLRVSSVPGTGTAFDIYLPPSGGAIGEC